MLKKISLVATLAVVLFLTINSNAQILLSGGLSYSQNFDSLSNTPAATTYTWTDNATVGLAGWYASRSFTGGTATLFGPYAYTGYRVGDGSANNGTIWSYGTILNADRALGTSSSGTPKTNAFGLRIQNDTASPLGTVTIAYTGEQWRNGGNTAVQSLLFSYKISATPFASPLDTVAPGVNGWTPFSSLDFLSPTTGATAATLDGNLAANRTVFSATVLTGVTLNPGEEIFLRWTDLDDSGNDHGFGVDDFSVSFSAVPEPATMTIAGFATLGLIIWRRNRK